MVSNDEDSGSNFKCLCYIWTKVYVYTGIYCQADKVIFCSKGEGNYVLYNSPPPLSIHGKVNWQKMLCDACSKRFTEHVARARRGKGQKGITVDSRGLF